MPRDYYEILGVPQGADPSEIKSAFRRLARQYHPDVSREADAEDRFKEINEAYEVLSDDDKRGPLRPLWACRRQWRGWRVMARAFPTLAIFLIFSTALLAGLLAGARRGPASGRDRRVDVTIDFVEAVFGVEKEVEFQRLEDCDDCDGTGAEAGSRPSTCATCNGSGEVRQVQQTFLGSMARVHTCPNCGGRGQVIRRPCRNCDGSGRRRKRAILSVKIPAGVGDGVQIQVRGDGDAGEHGAPPGNLFVVVHVKDHSYFRRDENDIIIDIGINIAQATLGDRINVETVDGPVELAIPPGTQTGKVFRLRGKGFPLFAFRWQQFGARRPDGLCAGGDADRPYRAAARALRRIGCNPRARECPADRRDADYGTRWPTSSPAMIRRLKP